MSERKKSISAGIGAVLGTLSDGGVCPADRTEIRVHTLNDNDDKETTLYRLQKGTLRQTLAKVEPLFHAPLISKSASLLLLFFRNSPLLSWTVSLIAELTRARCL